MSFISFGPQSRIVPGTGKPSAKIAIIGDYTSNFDDSALKPFSGPAGTVLDSCLHAAKIIRPEVYLTNVFKSKTTFTGKNANYDFFNETKRTFTDKGLQHVKMLHDELNSIDANVIVTASLPALMALTDLKSVSTFRGYVTPSTKLRNVRKIIPTHSPYATIRGSFLNRHLIVADLKKAKQESVTPDIIRPERTLVYDFSTVEEVLQWLEFYETQPVISFDIEVINYEVSCISFASTPEVGVSIPIGTTDYRPGGWTESDELQIWRGIQRVLGNPNSTKIAQNCIFDIQFLLTRCGIEVRGPIRDTLIGHSVMFPELPKGLAFLGSLYCGSQEYWKDKVKFDNIKGEA